MQIFVVMNPEKVLGRLSTHDRRMEEAISRWQTIAGNAVLDEARRLVPFRTGKTRASLYAETRGTTVRVGSRSPVAAYLNNGTRAHTIRPIGAKALRFYIGGRAVFAKYVRHPGTKPTRFLQRALDNKKEFVVSLLRQYTLQESKFLD